MKDLKLFSEMQLKSRVYCALVTLCLAFLASCGGAPHRPAPVEDRNAPKPSAAVREVVAEVPAAKPAPAASTAAPAPMPGSENAGKPGYYTVKPGDTLARIGLESGQNYRDIARWNNLDNPNRIEAGQVLRVIPPGTSEEGSVTRAVAANKIAVAPLPAASAPKTVASATLAPSATAASAAPAPTPAPAPMLVEDDATFIWPARGTIVASFDEAKNRKGLDIGGAAGDPVIAAADGKVVYAGSGLRGYGNLIIIKHNNTFLTAYAHNQTLLVKEEQSVKQGQKIAEMGNSDTDQVKLHFEVRKLGKPVDPVKHLPSR